MRCPFTGYVPWPIPPLDDRFAARNPTDNSPAGPDDIPPVTSLLSDASAVPPYWRQVIAADKARAAASVGPAEQRDIGQALDRFRNAFFQAWRGYSGLQGQDALDGYSDFSQSLDQARDKVLTGVSGPTRTMVKPLLDDMHLEGLHAGLAHYGQQNDGIARNVASPTFPSNGSSTAKPDSGIGRRMQLAQWNGEGSTDLNIQPLMPGDSSPATEIDQSQFTETQKQEAKEIASKILKGQVGVWDWNIGNMRPNGDPWAGAGEPYNNYETSIAPEYGVRMNARNLFQYGVVLRQRGEPFDIRHVANLWASGAGDNPADWAGGVSEWSTIPQNA